jgi:hypothetical protein
MDAWAPFNDRKMLGVASKVTKDVFFHTLMCFIYQAFSPGRGHQRRAGGRPRDSGSHEPCDAHMRAASRVSAAWTRPERDGDVWVPSRDLPQHGLRLADARHAPPGVHAARHSPWPASPVPEDGRGIRYIVYSCRTWHGMTQLWFYLVSDAL